MMTRKSLSIGIALMAVLAVMGAFLVVWGYAQLNRPAPLNEPVLFMVEKGSSVKKIAAELQKNGLIDNPFIFEIAARFIRFKPLQAGEYQIPPQATMGDMIALFQSGKTYQRQVTIAEGLTVKQIKLILDAADGLVGDITTLPPEGALLPETYNYTKGDSREALIARMKTAHDALLEQLWPERDTDLPIKTPQEAVILASIVERETGVAAERAKAAGVFINRLNRGMMLQSDPTVIYPLSDGLGVLDRPLYRKDWQFKSPYNTYQNAGLPPTPIANPGEASLRAVLKPEKHEYLYFVADGTGGHAFAKTLTEHNANVAKWRAIKKQKGIP